MRKFKYDKEHGILIELPQEGTNFYDYENSFLMEFAVSEELKLQLDAFQFETTLVLDKDFYVNNGNLINGKQIALPTLKSLVNSDTKFSTQFINDQIKNNKVDTNLISDGYHTFQELYHHRCILFIALCKQLYNESLEGGVTDDGIGVYRTRFDSENKYCGDGWFLMGVGVQKGKQISYHLPFDLWDECKFANSLEKAPAFDGHTSKDVIDRLLKYYIR